MKYPFAIAAHFDKMALTMSKLADLWREMRRATFPVQIQREFRKTDDSVEPPKGAQKVKPVLVREFLYANVEVLPKSKGALNWNLNRILANRERYEMISMRLKDTVPWYIVATIHSLESSLRFDRHLHNGDSLKRRTSRVPKGRPLKGKPPFTFSDSAIDAIRMKEFHLIDWSDIGEALWKLEQYNGLGYFYKEMQSPYLWGGTNHQQKGKYVSDGKFDPNAVTKQIGAAILIKNLKDA